VKTYRRIVRRRIEGALRLRLRTADQRDRVTPRAIGSRQDIPVEIIDLDALPEMSEVRTQGSFAGPPHTARGRRR
jgi:hypothetical protein